MKWSKMTSVDKTFLILTSLEKAGPYGGVLWQSNLDSVGTLEFPCARIDANRSKFFIDLPEGHEFKSDLPLKFRFFYRSIIFDVSPENYILKETVLECSIPSEIQVASRLPHEMFGFPVNKQLLSNLRLNDTDVIGKIVKTSDKSIGILIFGLGTRHFEVDTPIHIVPTDKKFNFEELRGNIKSCSVESIKESSIRLEIGLETRIEEEMVDYFNQKGNLILLSGHKH